MIGMLKGNLAEKGALYAIVDVNGVGYKVFVPLPILDSLKLGENTTLFTYLAVRENALDLYGFKSNQEKALFELLLTVSGIGPKTALGVMNTASPSQIEKAVVEQNAGFLTKVAGVGKKISEKIVLELKGKIISTSKDSYGSDADGDVVEALISLGYSQKQVRDAVREMPKNLETSSDKVKFALKHIKPNAK